MAKKLIIYCAVPIYNTWVTRWEFEKFLNNGFKIEFWDTTNIFYKDYKLPDLSVSDNYEYNEKDVFKINTFNHLKKKVQELHFTTLVCILNRGPLETKFFDNRDLDIFNKYRIKYICLHLIPYLDNHNIFSKFKQLIRYLKLKILNRKKKPYLVLSCGKQGRLQSDRIYKKRKFFKSVPHFNIEWVEKKREIKDRYLVYVDEAANFSPDAHLLGHPNPCLDISEFYKNINNLFDKIENWIELKIIVLASGKYKYKSNPFGQREIIYEKSLDLIHHSELVIGHKSSAIQQAVVDLKPILLVKDRNFITIKNKKIENYARIWGIKSVWSHRLTKVDLDKKNLINSLAFKKYTKDYLKEDNFSGSFADNVILQLNKLSKE